MKITIFREWEDFFQEKELNFIFNQCTTKYMHLTCSSENCGIGTMEIVVVVVIIIIIMIIIIIISVYINSQ